MSHSQHPPPWLARYANSYHAWKTIPSSITSSSLPSSLSHDPTTPPSFTPSKPPTSSDLQTLSPPSHTRPLGLTEHSFDIDGTHFEGRADVHSLLTLSVSTSFSRDEVQKKVLLAWAALRMGHAFLRVRVVDGVMDEGAVGVEKGEVGKGESEGKGGEKENGKERMFVVDGVRGMEEAMAEARRTIVFLDGELDVGVFWRHAMNTGRLIEPRREMARMIVLPLEEQRRDCHGHDDGEREVGDEDKGNGKGEGKRKPKTETKYILHTLLVVGHAVIDGLTSYTWHAHFTALLNSTISSLHAQLNSSLLPARVAASLPKAQEDLYPPRAGNIPRQRWAWAISRILRHVRRPPPAAFQNPLRRDVPLAKAQEMPDLFPDVLDYSKTPPLNSFTVATTLSLRATGRLRRLCRETGVSVGAGAFALVGMSLMQLHERRYPNVPADQRLPFVGHFPVNPRPFFGFKGPADSMMLAFSDGLALPFLEASLPLEGRFRLLARAAHRQLGVFQKRVRSVVSRGLGELGSNGPAQLLPSNYLFMIERVSAKVVDGVKMNPQGGYPATMPLSPGTCGVSSVGSTKGLVPEVRYAVMEDVDAGGGFAANWVGLRSAVRVRDNEFLVGSAGDDSGLHFAVSYDGNAMDEDRVEEWRRVILGMLEEDGNSPVDVERLDGGEGTIKGKL